MTLGYFWLRRTSDGQVYGFPYISMLGADCKNCPISEDIEACMTAETINYSNYILPLEKN